MRLFPELAESFEIHDSIQLLEVSAELARQVAMDRYHAKEPTGEQIAIVTKDLENALGIVVKFVPGQKRAYEVAFVDEGGMRNGMTGVVYRGQAKKVPNILVHY